MICKVAAWSQITVQAGDITQITLNELTNAIDPRCVPGLPPFTPPCTAPKYSSYCVVLLFISANQRSNFPAICGRCVRNIVSPLILVLRLTPRRHRRPAELRVRPCRRLYGVRAL